MCFDLVAGGDHGYCFVDVVYLGDGQVRMFGVDHVGCDWSSVWDVVLDVFEVMVGEHGDDVGLIGGFGRVDGCDRGVGHRVVEDREV